MKTAGFILVLLSLSLAACDARQIQDLKIDSRNPEAQNRSAANANSSPNSKANKAKKGKTMNDSNLKLVSLKARAENTDAALIIRYEVENHSDQTLYLWDRMIGYAGAEQIIDHDTAYVFYEEPKTVRIIRGDLPSPKTFGIGRKQIPYARILPPKGKLNGDIKLNHPIKENSPFYEPLKEENTGEVACSAIRLMIAWTPLRTGMKIDERTVGGEQVIAIRGFGWDSPFQEILEERISVPVDLLIYKTPFERMLPTQ